MKDRFDIIPAEYGMMKTPLRSEILLAEFADLIGVDYISCVRRNSIYVWARSMVAYQMMQEGYGIREIAGQMLKAPASVRHMREKMEDAFALPKAYGDILELWNKFQNKIRQ